MPTLAKEELKQVSDCRSHSHWVAAYWSRALTQLASQGHAQLQTLSFADILTEFLNMNHIALQMNTHVAWEYDRELWNDVGERSRGNDNVSPKEEFAKVDENMKTRIER